LKFDLGKKIFQILRRRVPKSNFARANLLKRSTPLSTWRMPTSFSPSAAEQNGAAAIELQGFNSRAANGGLADNQTAIY
jgi:hypothetical protein